MRKAQKVGDGDNHLRDLRDCSFIYRPEGLEKPVRILLALKAPYLGLTVPGC